MNKPSEVASIVRDAK